MSDTLALAKKFIHAVDAGDVATATSCLHPDATIWHNYDNRTQTAAENMQLLGWMVQRCQHRSYTVHRQEEIEGGFLQQHRLDVTMNDGTEASTEALAIVLVEDGRITRIEEFIDPTPLAALATQEPA